MGKAQADQLFYQFTHAGFAYDHRDVKLCDDIPSKLKSHLAKELDFNFFRSVNAENFKFIVAMACMLGGKQFQRVPDLANALMTNSPSAPKT